MSARRTLLGGLVALSLAGTAAMITGAPAYADTPGCVTHKEYRAVHIGMAKKRVHHIFDTRGHQISAFTVGGDHYETREYKPCTDAQYGFVDIDYVNSHVDSKFVYWG